MQTNEIGEVAGDIQIPAGTFRVGDRIIRLTDSATNNVAATSTVAESAFKAKGLYQNRERLIISTREPIIRRESLTSEEIVTDTTSRQTDKTNWINPMAQSFHVDPNNSIRIDINLSTSNPEHKNILESNIINLINDNFDFNDININQSSISSNSVTITANEDIINGSLITIRSSVEDINCDERLPMPSALIFMGINHVVLGTLLVLVEMFS